MSRGKEVKKLREKMGMNRREFSDYYGIPYRTVQDWEAEKRELPDYLLRLLKYRAEIERRIKSERRYWWFQGQELVQGRVIRYHSILCIFFYHKHNATRQVEKEDI